jgi:hypothetical protein
MSVLTKSSGSEGRLTRWSAGVVLALVLTALPTFTVPALAQPIFETDEFRLNVDQTGPQSNPSAAFHRSGAFVGVWESTLRGVVARFFNRNRTPAGGDVVLVANDPIGPLPFRESITVHKQPVLAMTGNRNFLLVWAEEEQDVSIDIFFESRIVTSRTLFGQLFDLRGQPVGSRFRIGEMDGGLESGPDLAVDGSGNVTVVWLRFAEGEAGLFGRRFDADGNALTPEFRVDQGDGSTEASQPRVASLDDGTSLVVWEACCDGGGEHGERGIFGRFFGDLGIAISDSFQLNTTTEGNQRVPVVVGEDGRFVVAWQGPTGEVENGRDVFRVYGRRINLDSGLSGDERIVSSGLGRAHSSPALAVGIDDDVILTWMAWVDDFRVGVYGTRLSLAGEQIEPRTEAFRISQNPIGGQFRLGLSATPLGRFFSVWEGFGDDGKLRIAARLVLPASQLDCAADSGTVMRSPGTDLCSP